MLLQQFELSFGRKKKLAVCSKITATRLQMCTWKNSKGRSTFRNVPLNTLMIPIMLLKWRVIWVAYSSSSGQCTPKERGSGIQLLWVWWKGAWERCVPPSILCGMGVHGMGTDGTFYYWQLHWCLTRTSVAFPLKGLWGLNVLFLRISVSFLPDYHTYVCMREQMFYYCPFHITSSCNQFEEATCMVMIFSCILLLMSTDLICSLWNFRSLYSNWSNRF